MDPGALEAARSAIASASRIVFFTGAGMSAESGVPTFRGAGGLWRGHRPEELATPEAFARDPGRVTDWYRWRRRLIAGCTPHAGHRAIADACRRGAEHHVITQNVDGLHQRAGCPRVQELHGSIWVDRCERCDAAVLLDPSDPPVGEEAPVPTCSCGARRRPGVVWFGEMLPTRVLERSAELLARADGVIVVGTSSVVQPAASLVDLAPRGTLIIEVNPDEPPLGRTHLRGTAGEILPALLGAG